MFLFGTLFTMPNATSFLTEVGNWSSPLFTDFLPILYILVAVAVVILIIKVVGRLMR